MKPVMIYDGECRFCKYWIERWKTWTGDRVDYAPYQEAAGNFSQVPKERFKEAVYFFDEDGKAYRAAEAVFRCLSYSPGKKWIFNAYHKVPLFAAVSERAYSLVARHRTFFFYATKLIARGKKSR